MSEFPFQKFISLVAFDQTTNTLERDITRLEAESSEFQKEIVRILDTIERAKKNVTTSKKNVDAKELEMQELDLKQKEKQRLLDKIANQREYQSAYQEIERLKKTQHDFEEQLLTAWNALETATREYLAQKELLEKRKLELEHLLEDNVKRIEELRTTVKSHQQQRPVIEEGIPQEWLEKYAVMRKTVKNPVVPVINHSCSACFYTITQQDIARLRKHVMVQCKDCYRFLYME